MSDLTQFRDHARRMAEPGSHELGCKAPNPFPWLGAPTYIYPDPDCSGCITDADRALWARLADEADAYLARNVEEGLFKELRAGVET